MFQTDGETASRGTAGTGRSVAWGGLLLTFALALAYVESCIPFFFGVPGMKLGLPNLAVVLLLFRRNDGGKNGRARAVRDAAMVNILRIVLAGFLFGSLFGILFSLAGAFFSLAVMVWLMHTGRFGVTGVSIAGGVAHNAAQLAVAVFLVKTSGILYYAPFLLLAGTLTGALIGLTAGAVLVRIPVEKQEEEK
ncbi:MAG: Gx transporter family protein [Lachnospiraceae bacterium]|nr:Gx transporter family protein [Lachnospiraceae bacterium]